MSLAKHQSYSFEATTSNTT